MRVKTRLRVYAVCTAAGAVLVTGNLCLAWQEIKRARRQRGLAEEIVRCVLELNTLTYQYVQDGSARPREQWGIVSRRVADALAEIAAARPAEWQTVGRALHTHSRMGRLFLEVTPGKGTDAPADGAERALQAEWRSRLVGHLQLSGGELVSVVSRLANRIERAELAVQRRTGLVILVCVFAITGLTSFGAIWMAQSLGRGLSLLQTGTQRVASGILDHRIALEGKNEIATLARAFDEMTETLGRSRLKLEIEIAQRYTAEEKWRQTAAELKKSNHELSHFAETVARELSEPLRGISVHLGELSKSYGARLSPEAQHLIERTAQTSKRLRLLVSELVLFAEVGRDGLPFEQIDSWGALAAALDGLDVLISESNAQISAGDLPMVMADEAQFVQLLQHLIVNAIRFRGKSDPVIRVESRREGAEWFFSLRDNGIGIPAEQAARLFDIAEPATTAGAENLDSGLGLAMCRKIVERHGGRIWAESSAGRGTVFWFTMPVVPGPDADPDSAVCAESPWPGSRGDAAANGTSRSIRRN